MNYLQNNKQFKTKHLNRSNGFTLIELIITIAIAAIVLAIAVPSFQSIIEKNRISSETDRLFTILKQARNNAIITGSRSYICRTNAINLGVTPFTCTNNINGDANDWSGDFLMYTEIPAVVIPNPDAVFNNVLLGNLGANAAENEQMLQGSSNGPFNGVSVTANNAGGEAALVFETDGSLVNGGAAFSICDLRLDVPELNGRIIIVNEIGSARTVNTNSTDASRSCATPAP